MSLHIQGEKRLKVAQNHATNKKIDKKFIH